ncbi:MAG: ABC transporter permease [Methanotrichaceae archaeon]|nr:ABC transporter permease [Methanotrichaceae archaeon]
MSSEFLTIYWRDMLRFFRFRALLFSSLVQPALWLALYGAAMSSNFSRFTFALTIPPGDISVSYLTFLGAGVIALTTLFTSLFGGVSLLFDKNWGLMREIFASPTPRTHIIIGVGLSGVTKSILQVVVIMVFGLLIGVEFFQGYSIFETATAILGILVFVAIFSLGFLFFSSAISMSMETPESLQGIITLLSLPLFFASNALYPIDSFPPFIQYLSLLNPLTYLIYGLRYFAIGTDFYAMGYHYSYDLQQTIVAFLALVFFCVLMFLLAWRVFEKAIVT